MKKLAMFACLIAILAMVGCTSGGQAASSGEGQSSADSQVQTTTASSDTSQDAGQDTVQAQTSQDGPEAIPASSSDAVAASSDAQVGIANPWSSVASAEEAAAGAGLESFSVMDEIHVGDAVLSGPVFTCMEGIAQARYEGEEAVVVVRKGVGRSPEELAGDYVDYPLSWSQNFKGLEMQCFGFGEDAASLVLWSVGDTVYAASTTGVSGYPVGLSESDVSSLVAGIQ